MNIIAIDPGNIESAYVVLADDGMLVEFGKVANTDLAARLETVDAKHCVIEMIASYGMAVGAEIFETVFWIGRYFEIAEGWGMTVYRVKRQPVKLHHCHSVRAKDGNIRQVIIDRYGGKDKAIGKKKNAGPLYGVSADVWQALALGLYWLDTNKFAS